MIKKPVKIIVFDNQISKDQDPLLLPFIGILAGGVGSGKTNVILSLMKHWTKNKIFHKAVFYTPNGKFDDKLEKNLSKKVIITEDIEELKREMNDSMREREENKKYRTLMILDDVCADNTVFPSCNQHTELCHRLVSIRHLGFTVLITSHSWKQIPKIIRLNARFSMIWSVADEEVDAIAKDLTIPKKIFKEYYDEHTVVSHSLITYDRISKVLYEALGDKVLYKKEQTNSKKEKQSNKQ